MTAAAPRPVRWAIQATLAILCLYGLWSAPGVLGRWGYSFTGICALLLWVAIAGLGLPLLRARPTRRWLALLAMVAITLRLCFALLSVHRGSGGDPNAYLLLAKGLLIRDEYGIYDQYFGGYWRALFPPFYSFLLAGWGSIAGFSTASVLFLGTVIDLGAASLIVQLGRRLGNEGAGRGAAWLYLVWPSVLFSAPLAQKEGLCAFLILALALAWLNRDHRIWRNAVKIGVPAALLALTQPGQAPLAALFGLCLIGQAGFLPILLAGLRAACIALLVMLPWWIRNWLIFGVFMPLTSAGGASLWIGNNPDATGNWLPPPEHLRGLPEIVYNKRIGAIAVEWIRANPGAFVRLTITKFLRACGVGAFGIGRLVAMQPPLPAAIAAALVPFSHLAHVALLGGSAVAARLRRMPGTGTLLLLIAACLIQLMFFGVWFEFSERHREFLTPFLLLLVCGMIAPQLESAEPTPS
ncbi:MAG: glycosyltransferase [Sphingomonas sp.]|jgi:hypothetical protein|uniref:glycosyltransferase n=1 Tax=Sphingomonas sp. TaxID=28214 RepID=UPI00356758D0